MPQYATVFGTALGLVEGKALSPPLSPLRHLTVAQHCREVRVRAAEAEEKTRRVQHSSGTDHPETDIDMLTTMVLVAQLRYDPQLELPGGSWILTELPDIWKKLKAGSKMFRCR